jgi:hypothetical protein
MGKVRLRAAGRKPFVFRAPQWGGARVTGPGVTGVTGTVDNVSCIPHVAPVPVAAISCIAHIVLSVGPRLSLLFP